MGPKEYLMNYLDSRINTAKSELVIDDLTAPFLVALFETSPGVYGVKEKEATDYFLNEEAKDLLAKDMKGMCKDSALKGMALCFDGYTLDIDRNEDEPPKDISKVTERETAIISFMYLRDSIPKVLSYGMMGQYSGSCSSTLEFPHSYNRIVPYVRKSNKNYWFGDNGWANNAPIEDRFANPFLR
jgi:hypothetical protein